MDNNIISKKLKKTTATAVLCALAYLCTVLIKFPVMFLTMDIKDSIIMLCTLFFGVPYGITAAVAVPLLEFLTISDTGIYGLIMNIISSVTLCIPVGLIYKYNKSIKGAVLGLVSSVLAMTAVMMVANLFITPYYMHVSQGDVVALIPTLLLPFNFVKGTLNAGIVLLLYKPLSRALKKSHLIVSEKSDDLEKDKVNYKKTAIVSLIALAIVAISIVVIFVVLGGKISIFGK